LNITKNKTIYIIFSVVCVYIAFILYSDASEITEHFLKINITFLLIILPIEICAFFIRSIRQKVLLDNIGVKIPLITNFKIFVAGLSMTVTPGGSGNIIKSHFLKKHYNYSNSKTLPLVFVERFHDFLAVTTIITITLFFSYLWQSFVLVIISLIFLIIIYLTIKKNSLLEKFLTTMKKIKFLSKYIPSLEFNESLILLTNWKTTLKAWLISIFSWSLEIISFYYVFKSFGIHLNFIEAGQVVYTSILIGALSFIPAGIGFTEGTLISLLTVYGYDLSIVTASVLMLRIVTVWFATLIGFIFTHKFLKN
jgi:uncharacterized protein (TIRG00374 family)